MFHRAFNESGCYCCNDCEKHLINEKHGYVIPCNERNSCEKFRKSIEDAKTANRAYAQESKEYGDVLTSIRRHQRRK